jgi:post-segregation antitoxin (ccd killing protein)
MKERKKYPSVILTLDEEAVECKAWLQAKGVNISALVREALKAQKSEMIAFEEFKKAKA